MGKSADWKIPLPEVIARYQDGETLAQIGEAAGVTWGAIRYQLKRQGIPLRLKGWHRPPLNLPSDVLRDLRDRELSTHEIAVELECSEEAVRKWMIHHGIPRLAPKARPEQNAFWRGGYSVDKGGYLLRRSLDHPHRNRSGYVRVHRLVMEDHLGRYLTPLEVVDHRDGDTSNNRLTNLTLYPTNADHLRATLAGRKKLPSEQREALRQASVQRALARLEAILAGKESDGDPLR